MSIKFEANPQPQVKSTPLTWGEQTPWLYLQKVKKKRKENEKKGICSSYLIRKEKEHMAICDW